MNPYLLNVAAAMKPPQARAEGGPVQGDPFAQGAFLAGYGPAPAAPAVSVAGQPMALPPALTLPGTPPPAPEPTTPIGPPPPPPPAAAPTPAPAAPAGAPPAAEQRVPAIAIASPGGMIPAREATRLGPSQWAALDTANQAHEQAIGGIAANSLGQAQRDEAVYLQHAQDARAREEAANQVALAREDELRMRAADFDRQARELSKERIDSGRVWANKSTPQKVASFISIALGGFLSGARGGENVAWQRINEEIDRDVKAQEFAFHAKRAGVEASQTAYGMALQRYQSADAARNFARVAAMDAVAAEIQRQAAQNKGTEVGNRAMAALAELEQARADQILKGIAYIPSQYVAPKYRVANRVGLLTQDQVNAQIAKGEEMGHENEKINLQGDWAVKKENVQVAAQREAKTADDAKYIASALQQAGIPQAMESAEIARKAILAAPKGYTERVAESMPVVGGERARKVVAGKDAAEREMAWNNYKNQAMKALFGNVTEGEEKRANAALTGANDDESRLAAIKTTEAILQAAERSIRKGASDAGDQSYESRQRGTSGATGLSGVKGLDFKPSGAK